MTGLIMVTKGGGCGGSRSNAKKEKTTNEISLQEEVEQQNQLSLVTFVLTAIRKSMVACRVDRDGNEDYNSSHTHVMSSGSFGQMEIGWPTNVQHVAHVTFDRFNGFLGLPVEFEVEIPGRVPSASASVFGVSAESMQLSFDSKGNSVPTILLLMQERLYTQEGLKAEGIFRINPENSKEEHVRDQLNRGIVPDDIDVHCLAGLIKAWFRELPSGVLDGLSPEEVLQCNTEEDLVDLVKQLKPTESALLNWAVELMADVVEEEDLNKMNARNIAMVFAPNMTQMSDPLTALMHAVQVMNLLKTLIIKTLREREEAATGEYSSMSPHSYNQQSEEDFDSHQDMETSSESRGPASDEDEDDDDGEPEQSHYSESTNIVGLTEIEECFLRHLDGRKSASTRFMDQPSGDIKRDHMSFRSCPGLMLEPIVSSIDSKNGNSRSSTSDEEHLGDNIKAIQVVNANVLLDECQAMRDVEMDNRLI